jgi:class 3 adenylate cyclase
MEPRIQYAKTSDGVNIAYWTLGDGEPVVQLPALLDSQFMWRDAGGRSYLERLAARRKVVRYDGRGFGLSDQGVTRYSLDTHVLDLEAVLDQSAPVRAALVASMWSVPTAIAFAVRHPERVSRLVLWRVSARGSNPKLANRMRAMLRLIETDWKLYSETWAHDELGWTSGEAQRWAALMREATTPESWHAYVNAMLEVDVSGLLADVRSPTLVLQRRGWSQESRDAARAVASQIPNARIVTLEGASIFIWEAGEIEAAVETLEEFLGGSQGEQAESRVGGLVTILFTDLTDSTALTQRLGDAQAQELVRAHNGIVREALAAHGGSEIKHTGDGIMASFPTASGALECATAIQRAVAEHGDANLQVHAGLNAGEPVAEERDLFGTSVQLARRICDQAAAGEILASNVVRELAAGKGFLFADRGDAALRGFEDPVRLYEVPWREA